MGCSVSADGFYDSVIKLKVWCGVTPIITRALERYPTVLDQLILVPSSSDYKSQFKSIKAFTKSSVKRSSPARRKQPVRNTSWEFPPEANFALVNVGHIDLHYTWHFLFYSIHELPSFCAEKGTLFLKIVDNLLPTPTYNFTRLQKPRDDGYHSIEILA